MKVPKYVMDLFNSKFKQTKKFPNLLRTKTKAYTVTINNLKKISLLYVPLELLQWKKIHKLFNLVFVANRTFATSKKLLLYSDFRVTCVSPKS